MNAYERHCGDCLVMAVFRVSGANPHHDGLNPVCGRVNPTDDCTCTPVYQELMQRLVPALQAELVARREVS